MLKLSHENPKNSGSQYENEYFVWIYYRENKIRKIFLVTVKISCCKNFCMYSKSLPFRKIHKPLFNKVDNLATWITHFIMTQQPSLRILLHASKCCFDTWNHQVMYNSDKTSSGSETKWLSKQHRTNPKNAGQFTQVWVSCTGGMTNHLFCRLYGLIIDPAWSNNRPPKSYYSK